MTGRTREELNAAVLQDNATAPNLRTADDFLALHRDLVVRRCIEADRAGGRVEHLLLLGLKHVGAQGAQPAQQAGTEPAV